MHNKRQTSDNYNRKKKQCSGNFHETKAVVIIMKDKAVGIRTENTTVVVILRHNNY